MIGNKELRGNCSDEESFITNLFAMVSAISLPYASIKVHNKDEDDSLSVVSLCY